jgi:hypothetical protein
MIDLTFPRSDRRVPALRLCDGAIFQVRVIASNQRHMLHGSTHGALHNCLSLKLTQGALWQAVRHALQLIIRAMREPSSRQLLRKTIISLQ